ncbi:MAG: hypothetical protein H7X70_01100 [Candidatus Kapabacteria bacterium]|nr:hypothetical protein [Candidatus Kapabacteria bacterium]
MRHLFLIAILFCAPMLAFAQIGALLVPFAPKDCINDARGAAGGIPNNARLVGLMNAGLQVPLGTDVVDIGMNSKDGKARLWYYVFIAGPNDTVAAVPMVRLVFACQDPTSLAGGASVDVPLDGISNTPLPSGYREGPALATALSGNAEYQRFKVSYPDSQPGISILTTSTEDAFSFPSGTAFWAVSWTDAVSGGVSEPFTCLVHAMTGQTLCGNELALSVAETNDPTVYLAPNPARDNAVLNLPLSWMGRHVVIEAISSTGSFIELSSINALPTPITSINTSLLASGAYTVRARTATEYVVLPMSVIR